MSKSPTDQPDPPSRPRARSIEAGLTLRIRERADMVEGWFLREGLREGQVRHRLRTEHGLTKWQSNHVIRQVRLRWKREAPPREQARDEHRAWLAEFRSAALAAKEPMAVGLGGGEQRIEYVTKPDRRAALDAEHAMLKLDALMDQPDGGASGLQLPLAMQMAALLGITVTVEATNRPALGAGQVVDAPQDDEDEP